MNTQTAIITGGATGIGFAIADAFLNTDFNVVLIGRTSLKLEKAVQQLNQPKRIHFIVSDITQPEVAPDLINETVAKFGRVDVLVNNAGIFSVKPFTDYKIDELDQFLGYVRGTFALTQETVKQMRQQKEGGAIINIGTILAMNGIKAFPSSAPIMAKAAIMAMSKNLSVELASDNIRINVVAPGVVPTSLYGELDEKTLNYLEQQQPLGRFGLPKDIADAVLYLSLAKWVTGVILPVDGGVDAGGDGTSSR
ncbi:SDR family NAD(P)-dependent oxidoreductase [Aphanothece sacrum]|uniref:Dehydrogenase n=1 Tax=Aphanothece sacrum FPU1 TaxID=1920663 RepID=A0A401INV2_APHSA|nr:SDR family oxidoreductase [Aphanothece sacrum]GBF82922.1 dehydrogenase [Aphanothece sacrum FPU1]GBF86930.1 dehydrogenase [Aphanothece sacrum FPU3]